MSSEQQQSATKRLVGLVRLREKTLHDQTSSSCRLREVLIRELALNHPTESQQNEEEEAHT